MCESRRASYAFLPTAWFPRRDVGVGLLGLSWGGARAFAVRANCSRGLDAIWRVRDPSDQRRMRALD